MVWEGLFDLYGRVFRNSAQVKLKFVSAASGTRCAASTLLMGSESQCPASPERSWCEDMGLLLDLWAAAARTPCHALTQPAQSVPWHTARVFCSQMKPNVSYTSQFYLELTPAAGQDHKPNTCAVFSQQGISSGCRICQAGLSVANTLFLSWSFSSLLNVLSSRAGLLHLLQLWDGKCHLQGMLPD